MHKSPQRALTVVAQHHKQHLRVIVNDNKFAISNPNLVGNAASQQYAELATAKLITKSQSKNSVTRKLRSICNSVSNW